MNGVHPSIIASLAPLMQQSGHRADDAELARALETIGALAALQPWNENIVALERWVRARMARPVVSPRRAACRPLTTPQRPTACGAAKTSTRRNRWLTNCCRARRDLMRLVRRPRAA